MSTFSYVRQGVVSTPSAEHCRRRPLLQSSPFRKAPGARLERVRRRGETGGSGNREICDKKRRQPAALLHQGLRNDRFGSNPAVRRDACSWKDSVSLADLPLTVASTRFSRIAKRNAQRVRQTSVTIDEIGRP